MLSEEDPMLLESIKVFEGHGYEVKLKLGASMMWVKSKSGKRFSFYPTTGRWAPYGSYHKHYRSKGPEDFVERFIVKTDAQHEEVEKAKANIVPEGTKADLQEFVWYVGDLFDEGLSTNQVYMHLKELAYQSVVSKKKD